MPMTQYLLAAALGCAAIVSTTSCARPESRTADASNPIPVTAVAAVTHDVADHFDAGGVVRARTVAAITSRIMAEVRGVHVTPGDRVRAGQVLVVLDARELQANHARAESAEIASRQSAAMADADRQAAGAMLALAQANHRRMSDLRAKNSATQGELDEAVTTLRSAEARVRAADARISASKADIDAATAGVVATSAVASYATLSAPFDGVVTEKSIEVGNMVTPGESVLTVEDTRTFRLEIRLDQSRAWLVGIGDRARVSFAAPGGPSRRDATDDAIVEGRVAEIARALSSESHDFLIKVDLNVSGQVRSGMYGKARFGGLSHRALTVPASALVRRGQLAFVYVVERDSRAHLRLVNASEPVDGTVEIRSGLIEGERIVATAPPTLTDGSPVAVGSR